MTDTSVAAAALLRPRRLSTKPQPKIIKRSVAAAQRGVSVRTLVRRERDDPDIPQRVALGPNGGPPYGYIAEEWDAYLASRPRVPRPVAEQPSAKRSRARARCTHFYPETYPRPGGPRIK